MLTVKVNNFWQCPQLNPNWVVRGVTKQSSGASVLLDLGGFEPTGSFVNDYHEFCKRKGFKPMNLHVIRPNVLVPKQSDTEGSSNKLNSSKEFTGSNEADASAKKAIASDSARGQQFKTSTIQLEYMDDVDNEDNLIRLSIRGWRILPGTIDALNACVPYCIPLSSLW